MEQTGQLELTWTNKNLQLLTHGADTYEWVDPSDWRVKEVRPLRHVETVGETGTGNLLIQGDAAHVLDALNTIPELKDRYQGKVKLVYIDPPFNTGKAFEHYNDALEHSIWLTLLRDRLDQIFDLLSPDGSVWVHVDDSEGHRARSILDEAFGPGHFVATIIWQSVDSPSDNKVPLAADHDFIHVYSKKPKGTILLPKFDESILKGYPNSTEDGRRYRDRLLRKNGKNSLATDRPTMVFELQAPDGTEVLPIHDDGRRACWAMGRAAIKRKEEQGDLIWKRRPDPFNAGSEWWVPYAREWAPAEPRRPWPTIWNDVHTTRQAKAHLRELFPGVTPFDTPKPERLLQRIIQIATDKGDTVLDCFGGSGATAAVAHKMGRRWVTCEVQSETLNTFTKPRLTKVVSGEDAGGITSSVSVEFIGDLPEGIDPAPVKKVADNLKALYEHGIFDNLPKVKRADKGKSLDQVVQLLRDNPETLDTIITQMAKEMRAASKSQKVVTKHWQGGGGFDIAEVAPSIFTQENGVLYLAEGATNNALCEAVAAQVGYTFEMDLPFAGHKGRSRLAVLDGMLTCGVADFLVSHLKEKETLLVAAGSLDPEVDEHLRKARPGSRARKLPRDLARPAVLSGGVVIMKPSESTDSNNDLNQVPSDEDAS